MVAACLLSMTCASEEIASKCATELAAYFQQNWPVFPPADTCSSIAGGNIFMLDAIRQQQLTPITRMFCAAKRPICCAERCVLGAIQSVESSGARVAQCCSYIGLVSTVFQTICQVIVGYCDPFATQGQV